MSGFQYKVNFDLTAAQMEARKLKREFEQAEKALEGSTEKIKQTEAEIKRVQDEYEKVVAKADEYRRKIKEAREAKHEAATGKEMDDIDAYISELQAKAEIEAGQADNLLGQEQALNSALEKEKSNRESIFTKLQKIGVSIKKNNEQQSKTSGILNRAKKSMDKFSSKVSTLFKRLLIYSVILKAFRKIIESIKNFIKGDEKLATSLNTVKENLAVAGRTIMETLRPALQWFLDVLVKITNILAQVLAKALGKDINQMKKLAKQTDKTNKSLASFDTLQQVKSGESEGTTGSLENQKTYTAGELENIADIAGLALMGLGILVCLFNLPLGIGMVIAGALLVFRKKEESDETPTKLQQALEKWKLIVMGALLVIGVLLCMFGKYLLGAAAIIIGAAMLIKEAAENWNNLSEKMKSFITAMMVIVGGGLVVIGILLCVIGAWSVGLPLIAIGAAALVTAVALNWDAITEKFKYIINKIKAVWKEFSSWFVKIGKEALNGLISILNGLIDGINLLLLPLRGIITGIVNILGKKVSLSTIAIPHIPYLAQGAVIAGGSPFLATLGDQPRGQTNIEAPLDTIVEAMNIALANRGPTKMTIEATGSMAQLIRLLRLEIKEDERRASAF